MQKLIEEVLDRDVRPELSEHGGDVAIESYKDGILKIRLLGQCSGCPSAQLTTENLIGATLMEAIPQIKDVVLVSGVSRELMDMAKQILMSRHAV